MVLVKQANAFCCVLPYPPAVNNLYAHVRTAKGKVKRIRTERYGAWISAAGWDVNPHMNGTIKGPVAFYLEAAKPDNRKRDLDGIFKAPLDLLVKHGVIEDDQQVQRITAEWARSPDFKGVRVTVYPLEAA